MVVCFLFRGSAENYQGEECEVWIFRPCAKYLWMLATFKKSSFVTSRQQTHKLPRLKKEYSVTQYTRLKQGVLYFKKFTRMPVRSMTTCRKRRSTEQNYLRIPHINVHPNQTINVGSIDRFSFTPLRKVRLPAPIFMIPQSLNILYSMHTYCTKASRDRMQKCRKHWRNIIHIRK